MSVEDKHKPQRNDRATIRTVAAHAGVSVAAVSKVMRNAYGVSEALRAKVTEAIGELGYRPSRAARGLRGQSFTIGVLLIDIRNPFLPDVIAGVNGVLAPSHYQAMIGVSDARVQLETSLIESMIDYKMDGLILVAPRLPSEILAKFAVQVPIVTVGYHDASATAFDTINADDQRGAEIAVEALFACGYRDIGMLSLGEREGHAVSVVRQREIGFRRAMQRGGLGSPGPIVKIPMASPKREDVMRKFLSRKDRPRAVFCWSDLDAITLLSLAMEMGVRVPEDLAVIGYDNSTTAALGLVNLASIDQSGRELGQVATQALISRIEGRTASEHILQTPSLVSRNSLARSDTK
ncbi:LacI family DNA-binding transcriptional regulator [Rhizobium sp. NZLR5]|uniref:LacI family DNA-binding transcriptional regulator n=1 Tax=Rhizobium sp. NZLR5 TaxID=2731103 RepID=UPI001C835808|nr:LacI family DNA-binding transcriptional regulator [Rhizobium sp. NZLR5]MBX5182005.1 LacI family DNA-binding transcriptional regulator [Rhizobium sp. NZLR5]